MIWNKKAIDKDQVREISSRFETDLLTAAILARRNLIEPGELLFFLEDDVRFLHNPFLFEDMEEAVDRILQAADEQERVLVFGDRDVDGITSTVLLTETLSGMGIDVRWSVPSGDEPYGLTVEAVERFADESGTLIISVDCGISSHDEIARAAEKGIGTIVIDHHNPQESLPPAAAIINPKLPGTAYPFRDLCGCAVVSKVVWALAFAQSSLYNHEICFLNCIRGNESYTLEAVKMINFVETGRLQETIVPGVVEFDQTRLVSFLTDVEIYVYNREQQLEILRRIFGTNALIELIDIAPEIWKIYPALRDKTLLRARENSRIARYQNTLVPEIDTLINLFTSLYLYKEKERFTSHEENMDLVALGTLADLMPLVNENRILVRRGVTKLEKTGREGLFQLLVRQNLAGKKLSTTDIAWQVTPLINATGRMGVPERAVDLLLSRDAQECETLAEEVVGLNKQRKKLGDETWEKIRDSATDSFAETGGKLVLVGDAGIHRGITGILATRLLKYFKATAIVVSILEDKAVGSLRSLDGVNVQELLEFCSKIFTDYGGHDCAGGFSMPKEHFDQFKTLIKAYLPSLSTPKDEEVSLEIDAVIPESYMNPDLIKIAEQFEPFGQGNPPIVFQYNHASIAELSLVGKTEKQHVRMLLDTRQNKWPAVFWNASDRVGKDFTLGDKVDAVFRMGRNYFQNRETLQLTILDMKRS